MSGTIEERYDDISADTLGKFCGEWFRADERRLEAQEHRDELSRAETHHPFKQMSPGLSSASDVAEIAHKMQAQIGNEAQLDVRLAMDSLARRWKGLDPQVREDVRSLLPDGGKRALEERLSRQS